MKCQTCKQQGADWAWQPFGPDQSPYSFQTIGWHYRGFAVIKVCEKCKQHIEHSKDTDKEHKMVFFFTYKTEPYYLLGNEIKQSPF